MKRRKPRADNCPEIPERLARFELDEWLDQVPPEPEWWSEANAGTRPDNYYPWSVFKARRLWMEARRVWERETGVHIMRAWEQYREVARAAARTIEELNEPYEPGAFVEPDEDDDPRRPA